MNFLTRLYTVKPIQGIRTGLQGLWPVTNLAIIGLLLFLSQAAKSQSDDNNLFPEKPEPAVYVHDYSGWLQPYQKNALEQKLRAYWDSTSTQIVVMIRPDIGPYDKSSYAFELANKWGIGRKDKNNGVFMLIKSEKPGRGIFIATGYGTEGALPDITCGRIIRNTITPYFVQEQYYEGINAGLDEMIQALEGEFSKEPVEQLSTWKTILILLFVALVFFLILGTIVYKLRKVGQFITGKGSNRKKDDDDFGGGWWIGGNGWGGGGGSSSSGGGSWGGGGSFGGGSFGGGGAGGDW